MVEIVPAMARPPVEKMAPISGVMRVVPQVGQPAPSAMSPVMMPAFSTLSELVESVLVRFLLQSKAIKPIRIPCNIEIEKIGSQSSTGWPIPKMAKKHSARILRLAGKPDIRISSNLVSPPESRFMRKPKNKKLGIKPHQKRFSLLASKIPLPAKANSSSHFLQFIVLYYHKFFAFVKIILFGFWVSTSVEQKKYYDIKILKKQA